MGEYAVYIRNDTNLLATIDTIKLTGATRVPSWGIVTADADPLRQNLVLQPGQRGCGRFSPETEQPSGVVEVSLAFPVQPPPAMPTMFRLSVGWNRSGAAPYVESSVVFGDPNLLMETVDPWSPVQFPGTSNWLVSIAIRERPWSERLALCVACT